jgi:uncharacterized protein YukE
MLLHPISRETAVTTRVLSSDEAKQAITRMQAIVNGGLTEQLAALNREGTTLSDANVWDGQLAANFRGNTWPGMYQALENMKAQLEMLRNEINTINLNIMQAGGNA